MQASLLDMQLLGGSGGGGGNTATYMEPVPPLNYERFLEENAALLQNDPQRDLVLFPEDDISVPTLPRKFRTVEIPVPGPAR